MKPKKLTAKAVNMALSGTRICFDIANNMVNASLQTSGDMTSYFTGVQLHYRIGDSLWHCGQSATTMGLNYLQQKIAQWGGK